MYLLHISLSMDTRQAFASKRSGKRPKLVVAKAFDSIKPRVLSLVIKWPEVLSTGAAALLEIS